MVFFKITKRIAQVLNSIIFLIKEKKFGRLLTAFLSFFPFFVGQINIMRVC